MRQKKLKRITMCLLAIVTLLAFSSVASAYSWETVGSGPYRVWCYMQSCDWMGNMVDGISTHDAVTGYISNTTYLGYSACGFNPNDQYATFKAIAFKYNPYYVDRVRIHSYPYNNELRIDPNSTSNWVGSTYNTTGRYVECVQRALSYMGYSPGPLDGIWGTQTKNAIKTFQLENDLTQDGIVGTSSWDDLVSGKFYNYYE